MVKRTTHSKTAHQYGEASDRKLEWAPDLAMATGKGATMERFIAHDGIDLFEIDTTPWGEGTLKLNGAEIAHIEDDLDPGDAFRELEAIAEYVDSLEHEF